MGYDFFDVNFFPVLGCIFLFVFIWINSDLEHSLRLVYYTLIAITLIELVTFNLEYYLPNTSCDPFWMIVVTSVGYILRPVLLYFLILLVIRNDKRKRFRIILSLPLIVNTLFSLSGYFTDLAYSYDADKVFHRGPLGWFSHIVMIFYLIIMMILSIQMKKKGHRFEQFVLMTITVILIVGAFTESIFGNLIVLRVCIVSSILFYYMFFQSQVYKDEMSQKKLEEAYKLEEISFQVVTALAGTVDAKDSYTNGHSQRVADYSRELAKRLGQSEKFIKDIYFMAMLHDIGKIGIPDEIINKKGKLNDEEYAVIKQHPAIGSQVLKKITAMPDLYHGARWHHERYDGKGYPDGKAGEDIPFEARIITVADAYDAMSSKRSYRDAMPQAAIRAEIVRVRGTQLDPKIADIMLGMIDEDKDYKMRE